ncbi:MAG: LuxR C-terminal-related transcriptional regulator [Brevinematales bacterium]|nr:LuxR C-terminal-related transcriptional regulator [Brevinematales bacterium]
MKILKVLFVLFLLFSCVNYKGSIPTASRGFVDISRFDFEKNEYLSLNGEYEFYWEQLLTPIDFKTNESLQSDFFIFPGVWNNKYYGGRRLGGEGYATFRVQFLSNDTLHSFAIYIKNFATSYRIYLNGILVGTNGIVSYRGSGYKPHFYPNLIFVDKINLTNELVIQIANFSYYQGGPWNNILIGNREKIVDMLNRKYIFSAFIVSSLIIFSLLHLSIYILIKRESLFLYFSILCLIASVCFFINGQSEFRKFLSWANWYLLEKIMFILLYLPVFPFIIKKLFPDLIKENFHQIYTFFQLLLVSLVILTPTYIFTNTLTLFHLSIIILGLYTIYIVFKAIKVGYENAIFLLNNIIVFFVFILIDIITVSRFPYLNFSLSYVGVFIFIFSLHYIITAKFIKSFKTMENISKELNLEKPIINLNQKTIFLTIENELRRIKENEEKLNKIIENIPFAIIEVNKNFTINFLNQHAMSLFQLTDYNNLNLSSFLNEKELKKLNFAFKNKSELLVLNFQNNRKENLILLSKLSFLFKNEELVSVKITSIDIQDVISKSTFSDEKFFVEYNISPREQEVLKLLIKGNRIKEISNKLFIAESTVKDHLNSIYSKFNVKNKFELFERLKEYQNINNIEYSSFITYIMNHLTNE